MKQSQERITELVERVSSFTGAHGEAHEDLQPADSQHNPKLDLSRGGIVLLHEDRHARRTSGYEPEPRVYDATLVGIRHTFMNDQWSEHLSLRSGSYVLRLVEDMWSGLFVPLKSTSHNHQTLVSTYYVKDARIITDEDLDTADSLLDRYEAAREQRISRETTPTQ
jgi:hypothetical protein